MWRNVGTAWVDECALSTMVAEAARAYPCETGGVLLGYWSTPYSEVVVTAAVGPGPQAVHEPTRFVPDADYQEAEIARRYLFDPEHHAYLGDWHSHPHGGTGLSDKDRKTLLDIATYESARAPVPLMIVLTLDTEWRASVWRFQPTTFKWLGLFGRTSMLCLQPFRDEASEMEV